MSRLIALCLAAALLVPTVACRPPSKDEKLAETDELFAQGKFKTGLKKLVIYMRRNPGEVALRNKRLQYLSRASGVGAVLQDRKGEGVPESVKPSKDGYKGFLVSWIEGGLASKDADVRLSSAAALADLKRSAGADVLAEMLEAGGDKREQALVALSRIYTQGAYEALAKELGKPDVTPDLFEHPVPIRSPAPGVLLDLLDSKDAAQRAGALSVIYHIGARDRQLGAIRKHLDDPAGQARGAAARALGAVRDGESRLRIEKMLAEDADAGARAGAAAALGSIFDGASIPVLWKAFTDKKQPPEVRAEAAFSLSGFRGSEDDPEQPALSGGQISAVKGAMRDPALASVKDLCVCAAAELLDRRTIPALKEALIGPDRRVRDAAAKLLWQFEDKTVDKFLASRLKTASDEASAKGVLLGFEAWQSQELAPLTVEFLKTEAVPKSLRLMAVRTVSKLGWKGREVTAQLFADASAPVWLRAAAADQCRVSLSKKNADDAELIASTAKIALNLVHSGPDGLKPAAMRALRALGDKTPRDQIERMILDKVAKPREVVDGPPGEVPPEHSPLLVHLVAGVVTWL